MNRTCHHSLAVLATFLIGAYTANLSAATFSDDNWISMGGVPSVDGWNAEVHAEAVDDLGNLYIGGVFTIVGDVFATNIAKWDGSRWSALGSGINGDVLALVVSGNELYAGGSFTTAGAVSATNIARWNGTNWSALGSGMDGNVRALAMSGSDLYAGGGFTNAGGNAANYIAKWNGSGWSALGSGMDNWVNALAVSAGDVYVGGWFTNAGGNSANYIAKWDGSSWSALGSGMNRPSFALAVVGSDLYAGGGDFSTAGYLARWHGSSWIAMDMPIPDVGLYYGGSVEALAVAGNDLYTFAEYEYGDGYFIDRITKWDGSTWSAVGPDIYDDSVFVLALSGSDVYVGGRMGIAKLKGSGWGGVALTAGTEQAVEALAVSGNDLYAGGDFTTAGGSTANHIAKWSGSGWTALDSGMDYRVWALAASGSDLYAGGYFSMAGSSAANYVAKWNGSSWSALGSGTDGPFPDSPYVLALAVLGSDLYAGGYFTSAGGSPANRIAKWNGSSWSALGSGVSGDAPFGPYIGALAVSGSNLYAGGDFTTAGGVAANNIALWNGTSWSGLGLGLNGGPVLALAVSGDNLYAGGYFATAGGSVANGIAKWNGTSWTPLGTGMSGGGVYALAVSGNDLYAGGSFTRVDGIPANGIAKWNGSSWSALGSGIGGSVWALAVLGPDLYVGGSFNTAGGKVSAYLARARIGSVVKSVAATDSTATVQLSGVTGYQYDVQRATNLNSPIIWTTITTSPLSPAPDGSFTFTDSNAPPGTAYYRTLERP